MLALCPTSTPVVDPADRGFFLGRRMVGANWMDILLTLRGPGAAGARKGAEHFGGRHIVWRSSGDGRTALLGSSFSAFVTSQYLPNIKGLKRSWRTDESLLRNHAFPVVGSIRLDRIDVVAITAVVHRMQEQGYATGTINRVLQMIRRVFNCARKWQVHQNLANPVSGITVGPEILRNRFLSSDETHRVMRSLYNDANRTAADAILLLLLTGARRNEVTHARWEYVNWERRTLFVPLSKSGRPRHVVLSRSAIDLLKKRPLPRNEFIFPSTADLSHLQAG